MKAIRRKHGIFGPESDGRSLVNVIAALKGQYRAEVAEVEVGAYEAHRDPALAEEMKRKFQEIRDKIIGSRDH